MRGFDNLPAELVLMILSYEGFTPHEYHSLLLTSQRNARLAKPFLYRDITTALEYRATDRRYLTTLAALVVSLARHPENAASVETIRLHKSSDLEPRCLLRPDELETLDALSRRYLRGKEGRDPRILWSKHTHYIAAPWAPLVTILLALCSRVKEIFVSARRTTLDNTKDMVLSSPHGFPRLQRVTISPMFTIRGTRHGDAEINLQDKICWARCQNLKQFSIRGAGCDLDRLHVREDDFSNLLCRLLVGRQSLSIQELHLTECMLPVRAVSHLASLCRQLVHLSVTWARGPFYHGFCQSDLVRGLRAHQASLAKLKIDLSAVRYVSWLDQFREYPIQSVLQPNSDSDPAGISPVQRYTMGIGSLAGFTELRDVEISLCLLGVFRTVDQVIDLLPPSLENLVFLAPEQDGQMHIDELIYLFWTSAFTRLRQLKTVNGIPVAAPPPPPAMPAGSQEVAGLKKWSGCSPFVSRMQFAGGL